jgi:hypothetical protein
MSHNATFGTNFADDCVGNFALVKRVGTLLSNKSESPGKIDIPDDVAFTKDDAIRRKYR